MPLEQEMMGILIASLLVVMGILIITTLYFWYKNKSAGYGWTFLHLLLFSVASYFTLKAMSFDYNHPMASEEISRRIWSSVIVWTFNMFCLLFGILSFAKKSNRPYEKRS